MTTVIALVPAKDRADAIAATVGALRAIPEVARVLVVDDGSTDGTGRAAAGAGAEVLRLERNRGKGGAVLAGVEATPDADVYLLIDADVAGTAGVAHALLDPVLAGEADLAIGVLPSAGTKGGFGLVRDLAARGILRASGFRARAPLSGQRAVRAGLLRGLADAERFGLEVAMTVDAVRAGARVVEVDVAMDHRHTGRGVSGFRHRAGQGRDVLRSLWPRLTTERGRVGLALVLFAAVVAAMLWSGLTWQAASEPLREEPRRIVILGMNPLGFADLGQGDTPNLDRLVREGSVAAMSVRSTSRRPSVAEGYLTLGAGSRSLASGDDPGAAYPADERIGTVTAADLVEARTDLRPDGEVVALGAVKSLDANRPPKVATRPGTLGQALREAGLEAAVVGSSDQPDPADPDLSVIDRPGALAVMDRHLAVGRGAVTPDEVLRTDPSAPYGVVADHEAILAAVDEALDTAAVVMVDPGDLSRAEAFRAISTRAAQQTAREVALRSTDALLGRLQRSLPPDTILMVVSAAPPGAQFRLTPFAVTGPGVPTGYAFSPSTKREGIVAITDIAPTVLSLLDARVPPDLPGNALRYTDHEADLDHLQALDDETAFRERTYYPWAVGFIVAQAVIYLMTALVVTGGTAHRSASILRVLILAVVSFPLATFALRAIPGSFRLGGWAVGVLVLTSAVAGLVASRWRRTPLSGLNLIMLASVGVIVVDASTGTWLHVDSWLGYSLHSAGRFYGIPNTTFAVLAAASVLLVCGYVQFAPRRREAVVYGSLLFAVVALADGAPMLGGDVGGIITLVPLFAVTAIALTGRRLPVRTLVLIALGTVVVLVAAAGLDLARPPETRTHLGRFASDLVEDGPSVLFDTFVRKQSANLRILRVSIWTWMIPIVAAFLLYVLIWRRQWSELLPPGSPLRVGAVATLAGALLGFLSNDSGPVVIALFFVYLVAYLALLALERALQRPAEPGTAGQEVV